MDSIDEAVDYNSMDHSSVNRVFVDDLLAARPTPGDVLDLGTGTALIPIELCQREMTCRVMAADAAVSMETLFSGEQTRRRQNHSEIQRPGKSF